MLKRVFTIAVTIGRANAKDASARFSLSPIIPYAMKHKMETTIIAQPEGHNSNMIILIS
jgi:hypothetical protein